MFDIDSMPEFRSGNSVPVTRATISRERMREALEAYAAARVREAQQWISVDERLPDPETDVLVKCASKKIGRIGFDVAGLFRGEWMSQITETDCRWPVTHWMPLPTPPQQ